MATTGRSNLLVGAISGYNAFLIDSKDYFGKHQTV